MTIPDGARFSPRTDEVYRPNRLHGGVESGHGNAKGYALDLDSPTAVRTLNAVLAAGVPASLTPGMATFSPDARRALDQAGRDSGLTFRRLQTAPPAGDPIERAPRIAVLTGAVNQDVWSLRQLGFTADPVSLTGAADPLTGYDVVFNTGNYPGNTTARSRLQAFFASGGGYVGAQSAGVNFVAAAGLVTGLTASNAAGNGRSGIVYWDNTGGPASIVTGSYPARDTAIVDPPTWLSAVPSTMTIDARLPSSNFFAAGLWPNSNTTTAPGAAIIAHGTNTADTARLVVFANNPLYRADPEREWPMLGSAIYWADK